MSDDDLEQRLRRMPPAPLPNALMARLIVARPQPVTPPRAWWRNWVVGFASVAVLAFAGLFLAGEFQKWGARNFARPAAASPALPPTRVFLPVEERNFLVRTDDLGVFAAESPNPFRLVRCVWVDDATFRSTDGTSHARLTQPREQIIPVSLETY